MPKKGQKCSEEQKRKQSEAMKGRPSPKKGKPGKPHSKESKEKISKANMGRTAPNKGKPAHNKGKPASEEQKRKQSEAMKGRSLSEAHKQKLSEVNKGHTVSVKIRRKISMAEKGKLISEEQKRKQSEAMKGRSLSEAHKQKLSSAHLGHEMPSKSRHRLSATKQGIPYEEWEAYACEKKYCPKFSNACRESNRNKYGRRCFVCNKTEKVNGQRLSVHHVDMDKAQGCESNWKLVPLCRSCHSAAHNDELIARLGYLIKEK